MMSKQEEIKQKRMGNTKKIGTSKEAKEEGERIGEKGWGGKKEGKNLKATVAVSYTHLTLPTIYSV